MDGCLQRPLCALRKSKAWSSPPQHSFSHTVAWDLHSGQSSLPPPQRETTRGQDGWNECICMLCVILTWGTARHRLFLCPNYEGIWLGGGIRCVVTGLWCTGYNYNIRHDQGWWSNSGAGKQGRFPNKLLVFNGYLVDQISTQHG